MENGRWTSGPSCNEDTAEGDSRGLFLLTNRRSVRGPRSSPRTRSPVAAFCRMRHACSDRVSRRVDSTSGPFPHDRNRGPGSDRGQALNQETQSVQSILNQSLRGGTWGERRRTEHPSPCRDRTTPAGPDVSHCSIYQTIIRPFVIPGSKSAIRPEFLRKALFFVTSRDDSPRFGTQLPNVFSRCGSRNPGPVSSRLPRA